jgi:hypothetical protein
MPRRDYNLKASFDAEYEIGAEGTWGHPSTRDEVRLHYNRAVMFDGAMNRALRISAAMGWIAPGPTLLIFGSGYGWLAEAFEDLGFTHVVGIDTSSWIQSNKDLDEEAEIDEAITSVGLDPGTGEGALVKARIRGKAKGPGPRTRATRGVLNENGKSGASRGRIKQALGITGNDKIDWGLSEDLAPGLDDAEVVDAASDLDKICTDSAHYVTPLIPVSQQDPVLNWHTLEEWKALVPTHTWIEAGTYRVL